MLIGRLAKNNETTNQTTVESISNGLVGRLAKKSNVIPVASKISSNVFSGEIKQAKPDAFDSSITKIINKFPIVGPAVTAAVKTGIDAVENTASKFGDLFSSLGTGSYIKPTDMTKPTGATIGMTPTQREEFYNKKQEEGSILNRLVKGGEAGLSLVNFYPPIATFNAELSAAKTLPGPLSVPAKAIDWGMGKLSDIGAETLGLGVDELEKIGSISPQTSKIIKPFTQELAAFATLLAGTHIGFKAMEKGLGTGVKKLPISEKAGEKINKGVQLGVGFSMQPFSTTFGLTKGLITSKIEQRKQQGIEITPEEGLTIIKEVKTELPKIVEESVKSSIPKDDKYIPTDEFSGEYNRIPLSESFLSSELSKTKIPDSLKEELSNIQQEREFLNLNPAKDLERYVSKQGEYAGRLREVTGEGKSIFSREGDQIAEQSGFADSETARNAWEEFSARKQKLSQREKEVKQQISNLKLENKDVDVLNNFLNRESPQPNQFTSRVFERLQSERPDILEGDLLVERKNIKEDIKKATDLIETDKQKAYDIAMGKDKSSDISSTSANIALAEKALADGNTKLYAKLTKARSLDLTRKGQDISAERASVTDNSTAKYVKELIASRLDYLGKNYLDNLKGRKTDRAKAIDKIDSEVSKLEKTIKNKKLDTKTALALLEQLTCV